MRERERERDDPLTFPATHALKSCETFKIQFVRKKMLSP